MDVASNAIQHLQQQQQQPMLETRIPEVPQSNGNSKGGILFASGDGSRSGSRSSFYPRIPSLTGRSGVGDKQPRSSVTPSTAANSMAVSETKIVALFEQYKDSSDDSILADGIEKFCADLAVRPDEFCVLVLAWRFDAGQMCCFTREEFVSGCKALKADSIRGIQTKLPELCCEVQRDAELFKELYRFTFRFGLEVGQRILPSDMAICLWRLVFSQNMPLILERWLHFLEKHPHVRGIPRDTWNMFLNFVEAVGEDLSSYDDTEAWPSLFDDFVEFENDQMNQNISKNREIT
jgi:DCN1-like protein 3